MINPWSRFRVGSPSTRSNWTEPDCQPLTSVAHVAHVPSALRIVEDGRLRADLVFDKSKLNTERIRVVWLSPNDWTNAGGFRYGNVRFHFDWPMLVANRRVYWVESIAYGVEACRILLTDTDYSASLDVYDPTTGEGPWWRSPSGQHYWNGDHCLEIMLEGDLDLADATEVDFVKHHPKRCSIDYRSCHYLGMRADAGGAEFIAAMTSRKPSLKLPGLVRDKGAGPRPSWSLEGAVDVILERCGQATAGVGSVVRTDPGARALARAVLATLGNPGVAADLDQLAAHFESAEALRAAVADAIATAAGLPNASGLL